MPAEVGVVDTSGRTDSDSERGLEEALAVAASEIRYRRSRSSGPGGQHAQRSDTRVEALLEIDFSALDEAARERLHERFGSTVRAVAQDERSQLRNRELARERLLEKVRAALETEPERVPTRPTSRSILARLARKRRRALLKRSRRPPGEES
jgi:ribosome-associated protein